MKIIENKLIPFKGFCAINLFGYLFCRDKSEINDVIVNHEEIHTSQMKELCYIPFYVLYFIEWLIKLPLKAMHIGIYRLRGRLIATSTIWIT